MNEKQAKTIIDKTFKMIFNKELSLNIDEFISKFAFDIKLPRKVIDSTTGEETWSVLMNSTKFITQTNMENYDREKGWMLKKKMYAIFRILFQYGKNQLYYNRKAI